MVNEEFLLKTQAEIKEKIIKTEAKMAALNPDTTTQKQFCDLLVTLSAYEGIDLFIDKLLEEGLE